MQIKKLFRDMFVGILSGLLVTVISGYFLYNWGYSDGYDKGFGAGTVDGVAAVWSNLEAELAERKKKFDEGLVNREQEFKDRLAKRDEEFEKNLAERKLQFEAQIEQIIIDRYAEKISEVQGAAYTKGYDEGNLSGQALGQEEYKLSCAQSIEELKSYGRFWGEYVKQVSSYVLDYPERETDMRSRAQAIVTIALEGRVAAQGLQQQLNGQIDAIVAALEADDLDRVRELMFALYPALDAKAEAWRRNYRVLSSFEGT